MKLIISTFAVLFFMMSNKVVKENDHIAPESSRIASVAFENPRTFEFGESAYLDIDQDGRNDFQFTTILTHSDAGIHHKYLINALYDNQVLTVDQNVAITEKDERIEKNSPYVNVAWSTEPAEILEQVEDGNLTTWNGLFSGDREQYVGIKMMHHGQEHYGWVKISLDTNGHTANVEGYAINRVPGQTIQSGQI